MQKQAIQKIAWKMLSTTLWAKCNFHTQMQPETAAVRAALSIHQTLSLYINRRRENFTFSASCAFHSVFTKLYSFLFAKCNATSECGPLFIVFRPAPNQTKPKKKFTGNFCTTLFVRPAYYFCDVKIVSWKSV